MILRIASSRIVGQGDIVGRSGYFSLNLSANSVMRGRLDARRTLKSLVADLRMKRRIARKIDNYKVMPQRLTNKAMYLYLRIREHWSLSIRGKNYSTCYVMDKWGRVLIYSRSYPGGRVEHGHGYDAWHDEFGRLYPIRNPKRKRKARR